jgi:hypothetical protein
LKGRGGDAGWAVMFTCILYTIMVLELHATRFVHASLLHPCVTWPVPKLWGTHSVCAGYLVQLLCFLLHHSGWL